MDYCKGNGTLKGWPGEGVAKSPSLKIKKKQQQKKTTPGLQTVANDVYVEKNKFRKRRRAASGDLTPERKDRRGCTGPSCTYPGRERGGEGNECGKTNS